MQRPESWGMINGNKNILEYACKEINRSVPYFEELDRSNMSVNGYLNVTLNKLY